MLKRLLTTVLAKYKGLLWVVVIFQAIQAVAGLYLPTLNSDIINNGIVDGADLGALLGGWGGSVTGDLDGNGVVNGADLGILLGNWGPC